MVCTAVHHCKASEEALNYSAIEMGDSYALDILHLEEYVQRLFSGFPCGLPAAGLLLLRATVAIPLLSYAWSCFLLPHSICSPAISILALALGGLIGLGFCTPYAALGQVLVELSFTIQAKTFINEHSSLVGIGISLLLIGPGAWSIDAKLFGRKLIELNVDSDGSA